MLNQPEIAIGIDVGGTKTALGIVGRNGIVQMRRQIATRAERDGQMVLEEILKVLREMVTPIRLSTMPPAIRIGVSICELVDRQGNITSDYTIKWKGLPVRESFNQYAPTVIDADVRAHALAEATFGAGRGLRDFVFLSVGTGISSCLVLDGKPYAGALGNALVLSTMPVTVFDQEERKIDFALEPFASGAGLVARYRRDKPDTTRVEEIITDSKAGVDRARHILQSGGEALGSAVAWLVNVLDPAAVVIGGGLGSTDGLYWDSMLAAARSHIFADNSRSLPIIHAECGADAGIIGAATRTFNEIRD